MNNVSLVGRPTRDPELRFTTTGVPVCSFTLAVDRDFKSREGKREADFIFVKVMNKPAEHVADYVTKGRLISVKGRIATESYQAKDGSRRYKTEVLAENIGFLGPKKSEGEVSEASGENAGAAPEHDGFTNVEGEENCPF